MVALVSSLIGKFFISCVMATIYSYTSELFPDSSRVTVVGLCSMSGRVGGILAPELEQLVEYLNESILSIGIHVEDMLKLIRSFDCSRGEMWRSRCLTSFSHVLT